MSSKPTFDSEAYRIAEEAHKGVDDDYIRAECRDAARELGCTAEAMYRASERTYAQHFESR